MDYAKIQYFEKAETKGHQEFINSQNNCVLCGTALELLHIRMDETQSLKEEAHCPQCDVRTRAKVYTLI